jgi:DNA repair photolyase
MGCAHRCTFCYVRAFERRADRPADDRYGRSVRVKTNVVGVLRQELRKPGWNRQLVSIGAATDPYQSAEGTYRLTRGCIEVLAASSTPISVITRSPMVMRDIDVIGEASRRAEVTISFSVPTLDVEVWRNTEPGTAPPRQRLRALRALTDAGIRAGVGMAPLLPGISDRPEQLVEVVKAAHDAGANYVWANVLYLKPGTREHFLSHLARDWPEELQRYERMYTHAYLDKSLTDPMLERVAALKLEYGMQDRPQDLRPLTPSLAAIPEQLSLFAQPSAFHPDEAYLPPERRGRAQRDESGSLARRVS